MLRLLELRATRAEFSPFAAQRVERLAPQVFVVRRGSGQGLLCLTNLTTERVDLPGVSGHDLISGERYDQVMMEPYGRLWLENCPPQ
ncbi:MAG: DUF3459 domain-containing protein [Micropruina sp.]|nr:DUF3459 domain-containing protein [Micropruina sp.]